MGSCTQTPTSLTPLRLVSIGGQGMNYLSRCPSGHRACPVAGTPSHGRGDTAEVGRVTGRS